MPLDPDAIAGVVVTAIKSALAPIQERLAALEERPVAVAAPDVAPDDIAASVAGLLRKELADLPVAPRMQKRIVRDADGQIARVIEEPV